MNPKHIELYSVQKDVFKNWRTVQKNRQEKAPLIECVTGKGDDAGKKPSCQMTTVRQKVAYTVYWRWRVGKWSMPRSAYCIRYLFLQYTINIRIYTDRKKSANIESSITVWKVISSNWRCQNVPLSITDMFGIDHKENVSLTNNKIVCD